MKKKLCFVTSARSEYGLLKWIMKDVMESEEFVFQLIVTGGHLLQEQGHTIDYVKKDGFPISYIVDEAIDTTTAEGVASAMGKIGVGVAKAYSELKPDYVLVLGDRYELLPICNAAVVMNIPIIHIGGGDVTEGAIDDMVRNAVTMMSTFHFPSTKFCKMNIERMRGSKKNIWNVGETGLDSFNREELLARTELADILSLDINSKWALMTYHPETRIEINDNLNAVKACFEFVSELEEYQTVVTYANADVGGKQINDYLELSCKTQMNKVRLIPSLGNKIYLSLMKEVDFVIGNSSSGILEAPYLNIPVINIGNRQKGRHQCSNVYQCSANILELKKTLENIKTRKKVPAGDAFYWGNGHASEKIVEILKNIVSKGG